MGTELNFEPRPVEWYTPERGWHVDALAQRLPGEPPGDPTPGGSWQVARRLVEEYRVADPAIVRASWDPGGPLLGREMQLELRLFRVLRTHKRRDDGAVEFHLHAHSRASGAGPPWVRLGFRLFGRRQQVRFYHRCCERIARLTARELGLPEDRPPPVVRLEEPVP